LSCGTMILSRPASQSKKPVSPRVSHVFFFKNNLNFQMASLQHGSSGQQEPTKLADYLRMGYKWLKKASDGSSQISVSRTFLFSSADYILEMESVYKYMRNWKPLVFSLSEDICFFLGNSLFTAGVEPKKVKKA